MVDTIEPLSAPEPGHRLLGRPRVLVAEPSPWRCGWLAAAIFERDGFVVDAVQDGLQALYALDPPGDVDDPDLLVVALRTPGLGGVDVLEGLRFGDPRTPVLVLAASAERSIPCRRVLDLGCAAIVEGATDPATIRAVAPTLLALRA